MNDSVKIMSLIPSGTEIVAALGLGNMMVGRSHECDFPKEVETLTVCTQARIDSNATSSKIDAQVNQLLQSALSLYQINTDVLEKLQPTHIVTQDQCDVCAVSLEDVETAVANLTNSSPKIISLNPKFLADVWKDIDRVAQVFGVDSRPLLGNTETRIKIVQQRAEILAHNSSIPTVACIEWTQPLMVAANWIPELVTIAGGKPLLGVAGKASTKIQWESLLKSNPDVIIFTLCGFDLHRTRQEAQLLAKHPQWQQLTAVQTGKVYITDGNAYFNRPGPRLTDSTEILAEILYPETFQYGYKGKAWDVT